jgi:predicted methyltransferase
MNRFLFATPILALTLACASTQPPAGASSAETTAAKQASADKLHAALAGSVRTDKERARDAARHPQETLAFFGVREDANVVELWPGGGYYTAILAPVLRDHGKLTVTHFDPNGDPKDEDTSEAKAIVGRLAKDPAVFGKVAEQQIKAPAIDLGPAASADFVLTFRNVHNWIELGYADKVFAEAFRVLKPGGVLGVEEHRGRPGMTLKEVKETGYVPEDMLIELATRAGFKLDARSEVNANARDTKDYPMGVWSLPPVFAEKDKNHDKYAAIGESDRMTLRFVKP